MSKGPKLPKSTCCVSKKRCGRCPIRMLAEGTLPPGYAVKKRRLVKVDPQAPALARSAKKKHEKKHDKKDEKKSRKKLKKTAATRFDTAA